MGLSDDPDLYFRIERLFARYCACLDEDRLEAWPDLFVENGSYKIISRENHAQGYPIPLLYFDNRAMM
ncbi:MAG: nuclear transport factor 2 family protein, partial [Gammaproteobacteria bacterium]